MKTAKLSIEEFMFLGIVLHYQQNTETGWFDIGETTGFKSIVEVDDFLIKKLSVSSRKFFAIKENLIEMRFLEKKEDGYRVTIAFRQLLNNQ